MEKYENLGLVGEGSYGMVMKCRHKETSQLVAIKKFLESEDDRMVKKIAMREIRVLKQLRHENLVNLLEVFRRKKRLYLVFEFVDRTVLDDLERSPHGLEETMCKKILFQVLRGIEFCHLHNIVHRDVKPENILVSKLGVVKLCDFGFARTLAAAGEAYTDYVATRWYRAPELLVGDTKYGRAVDIWAIGCLLAEMLTGEPLFPGDSDLDQLFHIVKCFGNLTPRYRDIFLRNPLYVGMKVPEVRDTEPLEKRLSRVSRSAMELMKQSMRLDADDRPACSQLIKLEFFQKENFANRFLEELYSMMARENESNPLLKGMGRQTNGHADDGRRHGGNRQVRKAVFAPDGGGVGREGKENQQKPMEENSVNEGGNLTSRSGAPDDSGLPDKSLKKKAGLKGGGGPTEMHMPPIFQASIAPVNERTTQNTTEDRTSPSHAINSPSFANGTTTPAGAPAIRLTSKRPSGGGGGVAHAAAESTPPSTFIANFEAASQPKQRAASLFFPKIAANSSSSTSPGGGAREAKLPAFHPPNKSTGAAVNPSKSKKELWSNSLLRR